MDERGEGNWPGVRWWRESRGEVHGFHATERSIALASPRRAG